MSKKILKQCHIDHLLENGRKQALVRGTENELDLKPVVKLFTPWTSCTWLLTEIDPDYPDIAFGLCDLGVGFPELGSVSVSELESVKGPFGLFIEVDMHWKAEHSLSVYTEMANTAERIVC